MKKYYLGLDIGISSVGWGIIGEEKGKHWLEDFGVRLFSVPEEPENKKSLAEKRRGFRSQRRLLNRWHCRREELKNFFLSLFEKDYPELAALLTCKDNCKRYCKCWKEKLVNTKTMNLLPGDLEKYEEKSKFFNPYVVRYQALSTKISLVDLLKILINVGKCRGYKKFYLDDSSEEKEVKESQTVVQEAEKLFQEKKYETVAEMIIKEEKFRHSQHKNLLSTHNHNPSKTYEDKEEKEKNHRHFIFPRKLLEAETDKILAKQSKYYPQLSNNFQWKIWKNGKLETKEFSAQEIIKAIIFRQRDFEDGPSQTEPKNQEKPAIIHWKKHNRNATISTGGGFLSFSSLSIKRRIKQIKCE
ncbi:MAG: CRISPR-associated protein Cas9 [Mycoplasmataceae bacterium RV_VA103A]|nr:MAG: CRISPR-associated protein Cas9 [Mycoplasmataceae bacterium RV_VA103A]